MATIAGCIQAHQDKVDKIMRVAGFCAGFRYNLAVRANAFQCKMLQDKTAIFPDISKYQKKVGTSTFAEAQARNELSFQDNPYALGGPREHINPFSGEEKPNAQKKQGNKNNQKGNGNQGN
ncbi:hypothetical protein PCASD_02395 [Puccinia coronata f. sp. avenae]|uniref:Uncharacterized protein n=1 Tax=Puccinia coronata f. sp. avenae TaxID=200324 RepID=A0A2N5VM26_9BASI|nr:hypothetical protein PCASD_02395 [Puccinia coronata f. sp. avenae]